MAEEPPALELRGITKRFPGVLANDHVDFDLRRREVHALLVENGAGKTTLMNILYGLYHPDEGEILIRGKRVAFSSPKDAIAQGIGMVHQHFMLIPVMTVAENIVLASEPTTGGVFLDYDAATKRVADMAGTFKFAINPHARVENISVGQQQRVEILKALYRNADILILDEPTAVLTPQEAHELFEILNTLRTEGLSIIFISHKLNEVLEIADRITVLRRGKKIETLPREGATEKELARLMVGREALLRVDEAPASPTEPLLSVQDLHVLDDRQRRGLVLDFTLAENLGLHDYRKEPNSRFGWLFPTRLVRWARRLLEQFDVRGGGPQTRAVALSGGNQQKVVLAREISREPSVLLAAQPTRGLDVGAIEFVHRRLVEARDSGKGVLLVSLELDEILSLSDRILVIYEGRIVREYPPDVTEEELGIAMTGGHREEVPAA